MKKPNILVRIAFVAILVVIAIGINRFSDKQRHSAVQPEPVTEQASVAPEPAHAKKQVPSEAEQFLPAEVAAVVATNEVTPTEVKTNNNLVLKFDDFKLGFK